MDRDRPHRVLFVGDRAAGRRVDTFLALRFSDWSRASFARWIREGLVRSDDRALKPSTTLRDGETLRIFIPGIAPYQAAPDLPPILHEDEHVIAFDKPAGLLMHPVGQKYAYALIGLLREARPGAHVDLSHRLDRETSGVVIATKTVDANLVMKEAFQSRAVSKLYWAIVRGVPAWDSITIDAALGPAAGSAVNLRRGADPGGDPAVTKVRLLARLPAHALVACKPVTGRTHQIRAHLEHAGFPLLGDKLYGQPDDIFLEQLRVGITDRVRAAIGFPRHALHARAIAFPHPVSGQVLKVTAPLPPDLQAIVDGATPRWDATPEEPTS